MELKLRDCSDVIPDWWVIEKAGEHHGWFERTGPNSSVYRNSARLSNADCEGYGGEMLAIAQAIEGRECAEFRRCAVDATGVVVEFWSPRNSDTETCEAVPYEDALALAKTIRETIKAPARV
jgi:hypothetical protein